MEEFIKQIFPTSTNIPEEIIIVLLKLILSSSSTIDTSQIPIISFIPPPTSSYVLQTVNVKCKL